MKIYNQTFIAMLTSITQRHMVQNHLIDDNEVITLQPHHLVSVGGEIRSHYIVSCSKKRIRYFLKVRKETDTALHCNAFLYKFKAPTGLCPYPLIVMPQFDFHGNQYNLYTFAEGETLEHLLPRYSPHECRRIAKKILAHIDALSSIHAPQYSNHDQFVSEGYADIQIQKMLPKLHHQAFAKLPADLIYAANQRCAEILANSSFSVPTLLHMDIKPANIIYNKQADILSLIDFELARFGDFDYGWVQILLTGLKPYGNSYKDYILSELTKNRLTMEEALLIPKLRCYLFYQLACNLIYYYENQDEYPEEMYSLFIRLLNELSAQ